jgi:NhaP-type Na+/H+ or K+/H+ antiporter
VYVNHIPSLNPPPLIISQLFTIGTCGVIGTNDLLACFSAGTALNWDGAYLSETEARHDEVNPSIDVLLNFAGFMYIGAVIPWADFHQPETTGITYPRLILLGFMVLLFRRIPSLLVLWKLMPKVCTSWKEALFMGYFGPIGERRFFSLLAILEIQ